MFFHLNPNSGMPIYRQLFQQLRQRIASGQLARDEKLPSARDLSAELKINFLTVTKVYQLLEAEGLTETRRGLGTFVAGVRLTRSVAEKRALIAEAVKQLVTEAQHLDMDETEVAKLLHHEFQQLKKS